MRSIYLAHMQYSTSQRLEHVEMKSLYKVAFSVYRVSGIRYQVYTLLLYYCCRTSRTENIRTFG